MKEQLIFPEIEYDKVDKIRGMDIVHLHHCQDRRGSQGAADHGGRSVPQLNWEEEHNG